MEKIPVILIAVVALFIIGQSQPVFTQIVVAKDGSGNFATIKSAIMAAPDNNPKQFYINIKKGIYFENIMIEVNKINLVLIGEGMERTIISGNKSDRGGVKTWYTSTVEIRGKGFMAQGITFENTAGPKMGQAVALLANAFYLTFYRCQFRGYQDTLYIASGVQFFRDCEVLGTIDFICGDSVALFQNSAILVRKPLPGQYLTITAQSRTKEQKDTGFVFQNCTIKAAEDLKRAKSHFKCYFGRPWRDFSRTIITESFVDNVIDPEGWTEWNGKLPVHTYYAEYRNRGPGSNTSGRAKWSKQITNPTVAAQFIVRNFLKGGSWIPSTVPRYLDFI